MSRINEVEMSEEPRGYAEPKAVDEMVGKAWADGSIVAYATVGEGPSKTHQLMVVGGRDDMESLLREYLLKPPTRAVAASVRAAVRSAVRRLGRLSATEHQDLMEDILLLLSLHLVDSQGIGTLTGSGLVSLAMAVHADASLPWQKRGMLDPSLLNLLGITAEAPRNKLN
jgi:hypothetical protein